MKTYLTNPTYIMDRQADYDKASELRSKFKATTKQLESGNGNLALYFKFNRKTKKAKVLKKIAASDDKLASLYDAIPSALALYRLCAFDEVSVYGTGPEGYKCVWMVSLVHESTGTLVTFGEHKGGFSFWTDFFSADDAPKELIKDLTDFLTYLVSDNFAHPYDGLVAGSVA